MMSLESRTIPRSVARVGSTPASALIALVMGVGLLGPMLQPAATAAAVPDADSATRAASEWLSKVAQTGVLTTGGIADWGLTAEGVFAHAAAGRGATAGATATDQLEAHLLDYASNAAGTGRGAGPIAKLLVVAEIQGRDVTSFGGWNLRSELLALMNSQPGDNYGRFQSVGVPDTTNGFSQALAVIGLARSGSVPAPAVAYLLGQQCPGGGFRLFYLGAGCTLDAAADIEATAMAVQALAAAETAGVTGVTGVDEAITRSLDWLVGQQGANGSFTASGPQGVANAQTAGLAAQALRSGGRVAAADAASAWVRGLQIDCSASALRSELGAVAYSPGVLVNTVEGGAIDEMYADQFVRATAGAALGMGAASLATLSVTSSSESTGGFDCSAVPGSTSTSTTTSTPASSTTSTTANTAPATTTTTIGVGLIPAASATGPGLAVEGISQTSPSRSLSASGAGSGSTSTLAATGIDAGRTALGATMLLMSGLLFVESRRRRG